MTDHAALISAAEARVAEARQEVDRLRAKLAAEQQSDREAAEVHLLTAEDGRMEARRRIAERTGRKAETGTGSAGGSADQQPTGVAAGIAEARRRGALRRPAGGAT